MSEAIAPETAAVQSPPPAAIPAHDSLPDPRQALHRLANELMRTHNRKLLVEFLQMRRALR